MKKSLSCLLALALCACMLLGSVALAEAAYTPGTYSATVKGASGDVTVETEVDETSIVNVTVTAQTETTGDIAKVMEQIPAAIVEAQSTEVDAFSGSTITTNAITAAVELALAQARGEEIAEDEAAADDAIPEK